MYRSYPLLIVSVQSGTAHYFRALEGQLYEPGDRIISTHRTWVNIHAFNLKLYNFCISCPEHNSAGPIPAWIDPHLNPDERTPVDALAVRPDLPLI